MMDRQSAQASSAGRAPNHSPLPTEAFAAEMNSTQQEAISMAAERTVSLVQGPPGTGKTRTCVKILQHWAASDTKKDGEGLLHFFEASKYYFGQTHHCLVQSLHAATLRILSGRHVEP